MSFLRHTWFEFFSVTLNFQGVEINGNEPRDSFQENHFNWCPVSIADPCTNSSKLLAIA